ncbi:MAG TPA: Mrp/NBP35 family ATP-binding protein [Candidatus Limnocylindrales bacterium]|nr:Mrp/NBP35 family ATP-binding protein [Candidatus Limnocylindrales bacterium]
MTENEIKELLKGVKYPGFTRDIVSFGLIKQIVVDPDRVEVRLSILSDNQDVIRQIVADVEGMLAGRTGASRIDVVVERPSVDKPAQARETAKAMGRGPAQVPGIARMIAVASGKGGVGKSTVAANLAVALAARGLAVGLLDADIYGPSIPTMFGIRRGRAGDGGSEGVGASDADGRFIPAVRHGVRLVSMGFFVADGAPLIWRGPMLTKALTQFLRDVAWGELDVLVLDLPPGTGDVQMTLTQQVALDAGIIVTTPQDVALADVERGVKMFQQAQVPVLGVIENMSFHVCPGCGEKAHLFGDGGAARVANRFGIAVLGGIPLARAVRVSGDAGSPIVVSDPDGPVAAAFRALAERVAEGIKAEREVAGHA